MTLSSRTCGWEFTMEAPSDADQVPQDDHPSPSQREMSLGAPRTLARLRS